MNIYLVNEDGETFCIRTKTMAEAIGVCEASYLEERKDDEGDKYSEDAEEKYYHEQILQSCALIGDLRN